MAEERERLSSRDMLDIGATVKQELERRRMARHDLEAEWKEVDRQIAMDPPPRETSSGSEQDWFPDVELPLQFNALEVIAGDARGLKFPRGSEWYAVSAELSQQYIDRFQERREGTPLLQPSPQTVSDQIVLDQETANVLVKATMDHFHRLYDFRQQINLFDAEMIKYGTGCVRVRPVQLASFNDDFRGLKSKRLGPATIACSIKNTYLDDSAPAILHEGVKSSRSVIRTYTQRLEDLRRAARKGGPDKGWIVSQVNKLKAKGDENGRRNFVELAEVEGDVIVPKQAGRSIFLPNVILTVAMGPGEPRPVRFRRNPVPFNSYAIGHYMRHDVLSPYGVSPLMKGASVQEGASLTFNNMQAVAALSGQPPIAYDRNDQELAAMGGPAVFPGAQWPTDSPNAIERMDISSLGDLLNVFLSLNTMYENLTGANDPRRGAPARSHTSATASENEIARGVARTNDFVSDVEKGPLTTVLHMEYAILKQVLTSPLPVCIQTGGIEGWARVAAPDLADNVMFEVQGSSGVASERQRSQDFLAAANFAVQLAGLAAQLQIRLPINFEEIVTEVFNRAGIQNASRFVGGTEGISPPAQGGPAVPQPGGQSAPPIPAPLAAP